ncbi:hypothetical protein VVD49_06010 [Uliginosibacterium sp. H3]|uniref:DUF1398 domain-containing protein n=1 Tax=Uliginosibacterium silvisoli TaxID=3114758 RepID=A0ABU6K0G1_9RHOO|nr:hypothetical protein [Uliginosibacterium sp. H3]
MHDSTGKPVSTTAAQVMTRCAEDSYAGTASFGEIVGRLVALGAESYHADYRLPATTYYMPDGGTHTLALQVPEVSIPSAFDAAALQAVIRGAQRGEVKYPEFLQRSMAAGCIGYIVWIAGRHVAYFGRRGEVHIEPFPS